MNMNKIFIVVAFACFAFYGCATTKKVSVTVLHPAEINMSAYKQIVLGDISGRRGQDLADELKEKLVDGNVFKIMDRSQLNQILSELKLSQSDIADPNSRAKIGKLLTGAALITGRGVRVKYSDKLTYRDSTCKRKVSKKKWVEYACKRYTRICSADTSGSLDVVDVQTGRILKSRRLKGGCSDQTKATDARPGYLRTQDELEQCSISNDVYLFLKAISSWKERREVPFVVDKNIPMLAEGIRHAEMGDLGKAAKVFSSAVKSSETNPKIKPASIAKAYWNLGLSFAYTMKFNQAISAFKKAYVLKPKPAYLNEQQVVRQLKKNWKKLKNQGIAQ